MLKGRKSATLALVGLVLAALACTLVTSEISSGLPTVAISEPAPGSDVPVNEPVTVQALAADPDGSGVVRLDLLVDDVTVDTFETAGPMESLTANLSFTPTSEGPTSVAVVAFCDDDRASNPATIALMVVGASGEEEAGDGGDAPSSTVEDDDAVQAQANANTNVRAAPGSGCDLLGTVPNGTVIELLERTSWEPHWYKTNYLGDTQLGWVYYESLTLMSPDSGLQRVNAAGCLSCGDGVCSGGETCATCAADCGDCCGNGACDAGETCMTCSADCGDCCGDGVCTPAHEEACDSCPADCGVCCGDGECEAGIGETCDTCEADCGACAPAPVCGDGVINQPSEICDGDDGCWPGAECASDCSQCLTAGPPAPTCGDGVVNQPSEMCDGDDGCWAGSFCAADCSQCLTIHP